MIPTAKEFLESKHIEGSEPRCKAMIEFARLHVTETLKQAFLNSEMMISENDISKTRSFTDIYDDGCVTITVSKDSILNSYSLDLIK